MYIARSELEGALRQALNGHKHIVVHGESGSGKSWLYKKILRDDNVEWLVADLANASRFKSITQECSNTLARHVKTTKTGYTEKKETGLDAVVANVKIEHAGDYKIDAGDPFENCLGWLRKRAGKRKAVLVWDNFERLLSDESLVREAAGLISLADNEDYAAYDVRLLIVGVPSDLRQHITKSDQSNTIVNRLTEIPEVARLTTEQATDLIRTGLLDELGYEIEDIEAVVKHTLFVTDRIPQHIHEYCLELANIAENKGLKIVADDLVAADEKWVKSVLSQAYGIIESNMNARNTIARRRDQTIYAVGVCPRHDFSHTDIESQVRSEFPASTSGVGLNISQILSGLADAEHPLLTRIPGTASFRLVNPKIRMCIRAMLYKDGSGSVAKKPLQST